MGLFDMGGLLSSGPLSSPDSKIALAAGLLSGTGNVGANLSRGLLAAQSAAQQERANRQNDMQQLVGAYNLMKQQEGIRMVQARRTGQPYQPNPMLGQMEARLNQLLGNPNLSSQGPTGSALLGAPGTPPASMGTTSPPPQAPMSSQAPMPSQGGAPPSNPAPFMPGNPMPSAQSGQFGNPAFGVEPEEFMAMANTPGGKEYLDALIKQSQPITTRFGVYGIDPRNPGQVKLMGGMLPRDALPVQFGADGKPNVQALPGQIQTQQDLEAATQRGKQAETFVDVPVGNNQTMRMTNAQYQASLSQRGQLPPSSSIPQSVLNADRTGQPFNATQTPDGQVTFQRGGPGAAAVSPLSGGMGGLGVTASPVAIAGATENAKMAAKNQQKLMADDYQNLSQTNSNAQTVISRLQTIKQLGPQAITGAQLPIRDTLNGLLSLIHVPGAADAKTAGDLVDKNAAQIALAIGAGSNGTDALRALAQIANPSRHMTNEAMSKAVDSLVAPMQMSLAKGQLLMPHFTGGSPASYFSQKQTFDQAADPRLWELQSLPPNAQQAYVQSLSPADAKALLAKRQALKQLGVLQ